MFERIRRYPAGLRSRGGAPRTWGLSDREVEGPFVVPANAVHAAAQDPRDERQTKQCDPRAGDNRLNSPIFGLEMKMAQLTILEDVRDVERDPKPCGISRFMQLWSCPGRPMPRRSDCRCEVQQVTVRGVAW